MQPGDHLGRIDVGGDEMVDITCKHSFLSASASEFHVTLETRVVGNKCVSPSTVFKYTFEVLYLSVSFSCYFTLPLHYISYEKVPKYRLGRIQFEAKQQEERWKTHNPASSLD